MIRSRFSTTIYWYAFFTILLAVISFYLFFQTGQELNSRAGDKFPAPVIGGILLLLALALFFTIFRNAMKVTVDGDFITIIGLFKNIVISKNDIKIIDLSARENMYWSFGSMSMATQITLQDNINILLPDIYYKNAPELKQWIKELYSDRIKGNNNEIQAQTSTQVETELEKIAGNPFTSMNAILIMGFISFMIYLMVKDPPFNAANLILILPAAIIYLGLGSQLHYFMISNQRLVVRNHTLPWIKRTYYIDQINSVYKESQHKRSDGIRINTTDYHSKFYSAGSLRDKHWKQLRQKLKENNVHVG